MSEKFIEIKLFTNNKFQGSYIARTETFSIKDLLDGAEKYADCYCLSVVEMTEEEYEKLPEFTGW